MASSDFDKPPSGVINITGRKIRAEPTDSKMVESNLSKNQQSGEVEKGTTSPMYGTGNTVPVMASNYSLDLSLLFSLYGPGNLSYQFAPSPNGSMLPFGLLPLGLAVPSIPVQQTTTNIINTSELTRIASKTSLQHEEIKGSTEKFMGRTKNLPPPCLNVPCSSNNLDSTRRKMSSSANIRSESTKTLVADTGFTFRSPSNVPPNPNPYIQKPSTVSITTTIPGVKNMHGVSDTRSNDLSTKKQRQRRQTQPSTQKIPTPSNLTLMQNSSFRDAEAAAILIGLRHGVSNIVTQVGNTNTQQVVGHSSSTATKEHIPIYNRQTTTHQMFPNKAITTGNKTVVRQYSPSTASHNHTPSQVNCSALTTTKIVKHVETKIAISHLPVSSNNSKESILKRRSDLSHKDGSKASLHLFACDVSCTRKNEHTVQQENGGFNFKKIICKKFTQSDKTNEKQNNNLRGDDSKNNTNAINTHKQVSPICSLNNSHTENTRVVSSQKVTKTKSTKCVQKHSSGVKSKAMKLSSNVIFQPSMQKKTAITSGHQSTNSKPHTSVAFSNSESHKSIHSSLIVSTTERKLASTAPSFSELRQMSAHFSESRQHFEESPQNNRVKHMLPKTSPHSSNLYRMRKSGMGDSNDSLHSINSNDDGKQENSGDESDTSCSSSEESNIESDATDDIDEKNIQIPSENNTQRPITLRSSFTLNRPKFTLGATSPAQCSPFKNTTQNVKGQLGSKVNIRRPTFTFSSGNVQYDSKLDSGKTKLSENVPELKFDDADRCEQSFKSKFIRALENPDAKKGLAVDQKSLRALLGEATFFYHNNKKYVLKRALTKCKPKEGFIADVDGTDGNLVSIKNICKNTNAISERLSNIEPRLSVTATKRADHEYDEKIKSKRPKTHKIDLTDKRHDVLKNLRKNKIKMKVSDTNNKRHRRTHEIDNLVFEGAGGLIPLPDISLRDSDVFSNIKLRRREAAKRGIKEPDESVSKLQKLSKRSKLNRKSLRIKAHKQALLNTITKHSFDRKLRKRRKHSYRKVRSIFSNPSCVRINAGADKPHVDVRAFSPDKVSKLCDTADAHPSESSIYTAAPKSKQSLVNGDSNCDPGIVNDVGDNEADMSSRVNFSNRGYTPRLTESSTDDKYLISNGPLASKQQEDCQRHTSNNDDTRQFCHVSCEEPNIDIKTSDVTNLRTVTTKSYDRRKRTSQRTATKLSKTYKFSNQRRNYNFSILSNFDAPSAITLDSMFGDLRPSYSVKKQASSWKIGTCAQDTKQKIQRKIWQHMTLNMFSNS